MRKKMICLWLILFLGPGLSSFVRCEDTITYYDTKCYNTLAEKLEFPVHPRGSLGHCKNESDYKKWSQCGYLGTRTPDGSTMGYYGFTWMTDGIAAIYEATEKEYYLQKLIEYSKDIMAQGVDNNRDGYLDYYHWDYYYGTDPVKYPKSKDYMAWDYEHYYAHACFFNIMRTLARCARVGRLGPHYTKYKADIDEIIAFLEKHVIEKWEKGPPYHYRSLATDIAATSFAVNGVHSHGGSLLVDLFLATGNPQYKEWATIFIEKIKNNWVLYSNESYAWSTDGEIIVPKDYMGTEYNMQDEGHATRVIRFAMIAYRAGMVVDKDDINALVNTFNKNVWRGEDLWFNYYVNGSTTGSGRRVITQWIRLGAFDTAVHDHAINWTVWSSNTDSNPPLHYYGILALNLKLRSSGYQLYPQ